MGNPILPDSKPYSSDTAFVTLKSCEGKSVQINKYFLYLFNSFYRSILEENLEVSHLFIFEGVTFDELILLQKQILQKHLQCLDHSPIIDDNQKTQIAETDNLKKNESSLDETNTNQNAQIIENFELYEELKDTSFEGDPDNSKEQNDDILTMECPFKCQEVPENSWTVDTLFAHIFSNHISDVKNNFYVSIDTFIDRLSSKLSSLNCALKCDKSRRVYTRKGSPDLVALKAHYQRCHEEDPVICAHCGDSFMNAVIYSDHKLTCNAVRVPQKCNLCDGKTFKNVKQHMKQVHVEKTFKCEVDGCSLKFTESFSLKKHTRIVHEKEKAFVCDKCGIKMAQFPNLRDHRIKVHREENLTFKEYKEMIRSGQHNFLSKDSKIPIYM